MARKLKVNMTGVESYVKCAEGEHIAVLKEIEEKESQNGSDMLAAVFEVIKGSSTGARVFDNFVLTEKALWKLKGYLEAVGMKADGKIVIDLDKLVGKTCIINVLHEEYNGQTRAKIDGFKSLTQKSESDDDEDDDDDEEEEDKKKKDKKKDKRKADNKKKKKKPEPEDEDDDEDDDDDWDEE
jgi:hypothetical protein